MDPTGPMYQPNKDVSNEPKWVINMLQRYDVIFTTRFIIEAMKEKGYLEYTKKLVEVSFPLITEHQYPSKDDNDRITLLFAGTIYCGLRSPDYFLNIVRLLDERFRVIFIGKGCADIVNQIQNTKAEVTVLPPVDYSELQKLMASADILINIGNSVPVHMPSKTLEYINTGKPIINFYKINECPTLYYTKRYPLCLDLDERDSDITAAALKVIHFCETSKKKQLDKEWILLNYKECTPYYIGKTISEELM